MRWKIWFGAALILVVGFLLGWSVHPTPSEVPARLGDSALRVGVSTAPVEEEPKTVSLMLDFGDGEVKTWYDLPVSQDTDLFSLMTGVSGGDKGFVMESKPPGEYGVMVDRVGSKKNGDGGKYWLFYVNNRMAEQSADRTKLKPGDVVEWKFVNLKMDAAE